MNPVSKFILRDFLEEKVLNKDDRSRILLQTEQ